MSSTYQTIFLQVACIDSDGDPLHLCHISTAFSALDEAIECFYRESLETYRYTYTAGHYGEAEHLWEFSHHEAYQPVEPSLPAMVILRYRPMNQE